MVQERAEDPKALSPGRVELTSESPVRELSCISVVYEREKVKIIKLN